MEYKTISKFATDEYIEKKSRFIAYAMPIKNEPQAIEFINEIKAKNWDASHNVYAYIIKENNITRYSDDGEPSGSAGLPILEALKNEKIYDAVVVVTRYFGGTLLGVGGLVRAYTASAKSALIKAEISIMAFCNKICIICDYSIWGRVQNEIAKSKGIIFDTQFTSEINATLYIKKEIYKSFEKNLINSTNGNVKINLISDEYIELKAN